MLSQDMIAKFPAAYAKLARQHASAELELIMEMAKRHYDELVVEAHMAKERENFNSRVSNINSALVPNPSDICRYNVWCGKGNNHHGSCEKLD